MLGDRNEEDSQEFILFNWTLFMLISRSVMYSRVWRVHGMAYIQSRSRSVPSPGLQYFCWLQFRTPDRAPFREHGMADNLLLRGDHLGSRPCSLHGRDLC